MADYFETQEYFVNKLWFFYKGIGYTGRGILTWEPKNGFHIVGHIEKKWGEIEYPVKIKTLDFERQTSVYLLLSNESHAILSIRFPSQLDLLHGQFSEYSNRIIFIDPFYSFNKKRKSWFGSTLLELNHSILLPDSVSVETKIGNGEPRQTFSRAGIYYKGENGVSVSVIQKNDKYLEAEWSLPILDWTKNECWEFARGLQFSLSALSGQSIEIKKRDMYRPSGQVTEILRNHAPASFGLIFRPFDFDIPNRDHIINLAIFLIRDQNKNQAEIARNILIQIADASIQKTRQGQELLLATILEAALRSIYYLPFNSQNTKRSNIVEKNLIRFREDYLVSSPESRKIWRKVTNSVLKSFEALRHRNAHPDWLSMKGGSVSKEEIEKSTDHMILLSRFYGYMIFGLAGIKIENPTFPLPVAQWAAMMTVDIHS